MTLATVKDYQNLLKRMKALPSEQDTMKTDIRLFTEAIVNILKNDPDMEGWSITVEHDESIANYYARNKDLLTDFVKTIFVKPRVSEYSDPESTGNMVQTKKITYTIGVLYPGEADFMTFSPVLEKIREIFLGLKIGGAKPIYFKEEKYIGGPMINYYDESHGHMTLYHPGWYYEIDMILSIPVMWVERDNLMTGGAPLKLVDISSELTYPRLAFDENNELKLDPAFGSLGDLSIRTKRAYCFDSIDNGSAISWNADFGDAMPTADFDVLFEYGAWENLNSPVSGSFSEENGEHKLVLDPTRFSKVRNVKMEAVYRPDDFNPSFVQNLTSLADGDVNSIPINWINPATAPTNEATLIVEYLVEENGLDIWKIKRIPGKSFSGNSVALTSMEIFEAEDLIAIETVEGVKVCRNVKDVVIETLYDTATFFTTDKNVITWAAGGRPPETSALMSFEYPAWNSEKLSSSESLRVGTAGTTITLRDAAGATYVMLRNVVVMKEQTYGPSTPPFTVNGTTITWNPATIPVPRGELFLTFEDQGGTGISDYSSESFFAEKMTDYLYVSYYLDENGSPVDQSGAAVDLGTYNPENIVKNSAGKVVKMITNDDNNSVLTLPEAHVSKSLSSLLTNGSLPRLIPIKECFFKPGNNGVTDVLSLKCKNSKKEDITISIREGEIGKIPVGHTSFEPIDGNIIVLDK